MLFGKLQVAPFDKREDADNKKREFAVGNSDHLTMLSAYKVCYYAYRYLKYRILCFENACICQIE